MNLYPAIFLQVDHIIQLIPRITFCGKIENIRHSGTLHLEKYNKRLYLNFNNHKIMVSKTH